MKYPTIRIDRSKWARWVQCSAEIYHGPGHQSITRCRLVNRGHKIHEANYGSMNQFARWKGLRVFSGCFDEPPEFN
jgi:hypothetical protein